METAITNSTAKKLVEIAQPLVQQLTSMEETIFHDRDCSTLEKILDLQIGDICSKLIEVEGLHPREATKLSLCETLEKLNTALESISHMIKKTKDGCPQSNFDGEIKKSVIMMLQTLCDVLVITDHSAVTDINTIFGKCLICLQNLEEDFGREVVLEFKDFLSNFSKCMSLMKTKLINLKDNKQKDLVSLCINQIRKCLPLLMQTLKMKHSKQDHQGKSCKESEYYVLQRISHCLTEIRNILEAGVEPGIKSKLQHRELVETECGEFVLLVDEALNLLSFPADKEILKERLSTDHDHQSSSPESPCYIGSEVCQILSPKVEKILCHAMSVSHVAVDPKDAQAIVSCGQRVLRELQSLKEDCASETMNSYEKNLHASSLSDALFCLEQKVNTALLRLVVEVFGNPCTSLRSLIITCTSASKEREIRCPEDLEDLIANYDLHMDRVVQIGVFAISCSNDKNRIPEIRSCLASLESLEPELVPTAVSLYLDPSSDAKASHLLFLASHWRHEVAKLQQMLDGIVDPVAFSRVTYEEIHKLIINLKKILYNEGEQATAERIVGKIISRAERMLNVCRHEGAEFLNGQSILISDFEFSIAECKAGYKVAFHDESSRTSSEAISKNLQRVLQRCLLIASMIKKLEVQLSELSGVLSVCSARALENSICHDESSPYRIGQSLISLNPRQQTIISDSSSVN